MKYQSSHLSQDLLKSGLDYYNKNKEKSYVVSPSLPILFFGDIESYNNSDFKVVTVGLNPSNTEFRLNRTDIYSYERFPDFNNDYSSLERSLCNYFKIKPYRRWFNSYEPYLNGLGCSYYPENSHNKVLHTDICSPLATDPTWSKISNQEKDNLFRDGFELWKDTINELNPDLIIISTRLEYVNKLDPKKIETLYTIDKKKDGTKRRPFNLELYKFSLFNRSFPLIYGEPKNTPLGSVSTLDKIKMGELTLKKIKRI